MKIEIVSIDGMGIASEVWRLSRDVDKSVEWDEILAVDGPVTEFPSAVVHFRDFMLLEREIFCSSRTHVAWARTSFVDDASAFKFPSEFVGIVDYEKLAKSRDEMIAAKARGEHQDRWRRYLPVSSHTCWSMRLSYREIVKYAKYFTYLSDKVNPVFCQRFARIVAELLELADKFTGSRHRTLEAVNIMTLVKFLHEEPVELDPLTRNGGIVVASFAAPFWLRAHWIRHRPITMIDDLFKILQRSDVLDLQIGHMMNLRVAASENVWRQLLRWRSCWLTQSSLLDERDPWAAVIDQFTDLLGESLLPCSDGKCPQDRDARNRYEGTDPGIVCPRWMILNGIDLEERGKDIDMALRSRATFWRKMVEEELERRT